MKKFILLLISAILIAGPKQNTDEKTLKLRIKILERDIKQLQALENNTAAYLEKINAEIELLNARISLAEKELSKLKEEIEKDREILKRIGKRIENTKKEIEKISLLLYKTRLSRFERLFLILKHPESFERTSYILYLGKKQANAIKTYRNLLEEKNSREKALKEKIKRERKILREMLRRKKALLKKKEYLHTKMQKILQDRKEKEKILREISSIKFTESQNTEKSPSPVRLKGKLPWPVKGKIVRKFGVRIHPIFKTRIKSNGIEIAPYKGEDSVRAVADGSVAFVSRFMGYGRVVILDHGGRYYTVYGHLLDVFVKKGDTVKKGDVIGTLGEGSFWKGRTLYFEIRHGDQPLNPLRWLTGR